MRHVNFKQIYIIRSLDAIYLIYFRCRLLDHLCGLVVRLPGCRPIGHGFDFGRYHIF
jgi:hypothetical protein